MGLFDIFRKKDKGTRKVDSSEGKRRTSLISITNGNAVGPSVTRSRSASPAPRNKRLKKGKGVRRRGGRKRMTVSRFNKERSKAAKANRGRSARDVFPDDSLSHLARALKGDDWEKLAYSLGFLPQAVSHFTGRASSSQNLYSQASMMLRTWRSQTPNAEIVPRLTHALQKIRRHDLALKMGLDLGVIATSDLTKDKNMPKKLRSALASYSVKNEGPPYTESKLIIGDDRVSFLARQLLAKDEWYRLAFALGFLPDEVSQIVASASSSQNLYTQAHMMLMIWRDRTPPNEVVPRLKAAFVRIRRHDLVDLLKIGAICGMDDIEDSVNNELRNLNEKIKKGGSLGAAIAARFKQLQF